MYQALLRPILSMTACLILVLLSCPVTAGTGPGCPDAPHDVNAVSSIGCLSCHDMAAFDQQNLIPDLGHVPENIDDSLCNNLCWACHNGFDAPYVLTHSSRQTDDGYGNWTIECWVCHNQHAQDQLKNYGVDAYVYTGASTSVTNSTITLSGASWSADQFQNMVVVPDITNPSYNYRVASNTEDTLSVVGSIDLSAVNTGDTFGISIGKLIRYRVYLEKITTPAVPQTGYKEVRFFDSTGSNSFADCDDAEDVDPPDGILDDSTPDGICQVCHTQTNHWRNDGTKSENHFSGMNCVENCHSHATGFTHCIDDSNYCINCHDPDDPEGPDPNFCEIGVKCYDCHHTGSHRIHLNPNDPRGPAVLCDACHGFGNVPNFRNQDGTGGKTLAETDICNTCHSNDGTYDGVNDLDLGVKYGNNGELKYNWDNGIYENDGITLKAGKEKWCATCHDESPSLVSGVNAPNVIGDEDAVKLADPSDPDDYIYGDIEPGWGYYKTGHGRDSATTYPSSGGLVPGAGKGCDDCHDYSLPHIDGLARTLDCDSYDDGDNTNDGCTSTEYQESYRLKLVDGLYLPMTIPRPVLRNDFINSGDFKLCLSNGCHTPEKYIDPDNLTTNFRDETGGYYGGGLTSYPINTHVIHLSAGWTSRYYPDWRDDTGVAGESMVSCVSCHNVHGSTQLAMVRDGKLINKEPGMELYYNDCTSDQNGNYKPELCADIPESPMTLNNSTVTVLKMPGSTFNHCENCHGLEGFFKYDRTPLPQEVPTLAWTGETGYVTDGVNPDIGTSSSPFVFRIKYTDTSNEVPKYIQVWVDADDSNSYEEAEKHDMVAADPADKDCADGKLYQKTVVIAHAGDGDLNYRFYAKDVMYEAAGIPASDSTLSVINNAPLLTWAAEQNFIVDGVTPNSGMTGSNFEFRVRYTDADNQCPPTDSDIQVVVNGAPYNLDSNDGAACNTGRTYYTTVQLNSVGSLNYHFNATDGTDTAKGDPTADKVVQVTDGTNPPILDWTGDTGYGLDGVNPDVGAGCIDLEFRVQYTDMDNHCPDSGSSNIQVWVDEDDNGYDGDEKYNMTEADAGDTDCTDGKIYSLSRTLSTAGAHNYRFHASDGTLDATAGDPVSGSTVTVTDAHEVPGEYTTIQDAINAALDGDYVCVADGTYSEQVNFSNKAITVKSFNGATATTIDGNGGNSAVVVFNSGEGSGSVIDGFTIDNQASGTATRGIVITDSSPTIRNSIVQGNNTSQAGGGINITGTGGGATIENTVIGGSIDGLTGECVNQNTVGLNGGGINFQGSATGTLTIKDSLIRCNSITWLGSGGGLYLGNITNTTVIENTTIGNNAVTYRYGAGVRTDNAQLSIVNSHIENNSSGWSGGGLFLASSNVTFENSTVSGNTVGFGSGGGIYFSGSGSSLTFNNSTVADNNTSNTFSGGGLLATGTSQTITIANSTFSDNVGREGGGINFAGSDSTFTIRDSEIRNNIGFFGPGGMRLAGGEMENVVTVERTIISGNHAQAVAGYGGGVWVSSSSDPLTTISATFDNCSVTGNRSLMNGGGFITGGTGSTVNITNCTLSGNTGRFGGGIYNSNAALTVNNSIVWGNSHKFFPEPTPEIGDPGATATITNTNIRQSGYEGNGNMNVDPLFVAPRDYSLAPTAEGDYHLQPDSPVIDQGSSVGAPTDDIDGETRPQLGGYDMGADEYRP